MPAERRAWRDELELAVEKLRQAKPSMAEADYYGRLEPLLLELASLYAGPASAPSTRPATAAP
jgi:hypothetical protein